MKQMIIDNAKIIGPIKPMNAVNNGPVYKKTAGQNLTNLPAYKAAGIPYARNHDASFYANYGGEHTVDVIAIFPDFDANPYDPASYDFHLTDEYNETILMARTQVFYRLGNRIEHASKKYGTCAPKDFKKWAVICEHIIRHMNYGWADGHEYGIKYWEIWNEPDLDADDSDNKLCWGGTRAQFLDLYTITAKHLKSCFPELKIGGPAVCNLNETWDRPFLERCRADNVPLDFFSWHLYNYHVDEYVWRVKAVRALLDEYGFTPDKTESILNEWNFVYGFDGEQYLRSVETISSLKGAAFIAGVMCACQDQPLDMLMYYDVSPNCAFNGLFAPYTYKNLKGYYPFKMFSRLYQNGRQTACEHDMEDIYAVSSVDEKGDPAIMITYFTDEADMPAKRFTLELKNANTDKLNVYLLDEQHDAELAGTLNAASAEIEMQPNTVMLITTD